jgi:hypothetical protein
MIELLFFSFTIKGTVLQKNILLHHAVAVQVLIPHTFSWNCPFKQYGGTSKVKHRDHPRIFLSLSLHKFSTNGSKVCTFTARKQSAILSHLVIVRSLSVLQLKLCERWLQPWAHLLLPIRWQEKHDNSAAWTLVRGGCSHGRICFSLYKMTRKTWQLCSFNSVTKASASPYTW